MTIKSIKKIGVIGAGTMGGGIARIFALFDYPVILVDKKKGIIEKALQKIKERTEKDSKNRVLSNIIASIDVEQASGCDLVIEAVFEDMEVKKKVLREINGACGENAVLATNTSTFPINELVGALDNPSRFIGMHFMNPPEVMKLVEVVKGKETSEDTVKTITDLVKDLEKIPAVVNDSPGFVSNRLLFALIGEALRLLENGIAKKEGIDTVMKYGMNHPMGPVALADFIGLDICYNIMRFLYESLGDERYKPTPLLESLVKEGKLGKKTGEGFYKYF